LLLLLLLTKLPLFRQSESSTDESTPEERIATPDGYNLPRDHILTTRDQLKLPSTSRDHANALKNNRQPQNLPQTSDTSSAGSPPAHGRRIVPGYDYATEISDLAVTSAGRGA